MSPRLTGMRLVRWLDEPKLERLTLMTRASRWGLAWALPFMAGGGVCGWAALEHVREERWFFLLLSMMGALGSLVVALHHVRGALRPPRTVTLTRGRIEVTQGRERRVFVARDFRFVEPATICNCERRGSRHAVHLWLAVNLPDSPHEGIQGGWVELAAYVTRSCGPIEAAQLATVERALASLGLRAQAAADASASAPGEFQPALDVPPAQLESSLRDLLTAHSLWAHGVWFLAQGRAESVAGWGLAGGSALAILGALTDSPGDAVGWAVLLGIIAWLLSAMTRSRAGTRGIYLFTNMLVAVRAQGVTQIPRERILAFTRAGADGLTLHYRSALGRREEWDSGMRLVEVPATLLTELETWRQGTCARVFTAWGEARRTSSPLATSLPPRANSEKGGYPYLPALLFFGFLLLIGHNSYRDIQEMRAKWAREDAALRERGQFLDAVVVGFEEKTVPIGKVSSERRYFPILEYVHEGRTLRLVEELRYVYSFRTQALLGRKLRVHVVPGTNYFRVLDDYEGTP